MLTFLFSLSIGFYIGILGGLGVTLMFVALHRAEEAERPAAAPRLAELMGLDATSFRNN